MCGFAGILSRNGRVDAAKLRQMADILVHRGPDDSGFLMLQRHTGQHDRSETAPQNGEVPYDFGLAFRRLNIIDLSSRGAQPMSNEARTVWIAFNGEIYNYVELRAELATNGRRFHSESDTEVILALYEAEGLRAFQRLNGMFAIAIWDQRLKRLILARDRFGVKPLYYVDAGGDFVFGSEIKALFCHPSVVPGIDPIALAEHFTFQFCLGDRTLYSDVHLLEPGQLLILGEQGTPLIEQFWRLHYRPRSGRKLGEFAQELRERLEGALCRQVRSDVPVGSFLSGGMDTGAVCALAARHLRPLRTFTCGFNVSGMDGLEQNFDERADARNLAKQLGTEHYEIEIGPGDLMASLPAVVWHLDEPRVGISHQIYKLSEFVRRHVPVVLSGTGGDEVFAGYPWRYDPVLGEADPNDFEERFYAVWRRLMSDTERDDLFSTATRQALAGRTPRDGFKSAIAETEGLDPLHRALHFEMRNFLQGVLLVEDRLNMAYSVEARVPLLDNDIIDLIETVPAEFKYDGQRTKIVLKEALRGLLRNEVLNRRKQGFTPPEKTWIRTVSRPQIEAILLDPRSLDRQLFRPEAIRKILAAHFEGYKDNRFLIWSLLCVEWMQRLFMDGDRPAQLPASATGLVAARAA